MATTPILAAAGSPLSRYEDPLAFNPARVRSRAARSAASALAGPASEAAGGGSRAPHWKGRSRKSGCPPTPPIASARTDGGAHHRVSASNSNEPGRRRPARRPAERPLMPRRDPCSKLRLAAQGHQVAPATRERHPAARVPDALRLRSFGPSHPSLPPGQALFAIAQLVRSFAATVNDAPALDGVFCQPQARDVKSRCPGPRPGRAKN